MKRVEHAVNTRLECNVPRYSTEHESHKKMDKIDKII